MSTTVITVARSSRDTVNKSSQLGLVPSVWPFVAIWWQRLQRNTTSSTDAYLNINYHSVSLLDFTIDCAPSKCVHFLHQSPQRQHTADIDLLAADRLPIPVRFLATALLGYCVSTWASSSHWHTCIYTEHVEVSTIFTQRADVNTSNALHTLVRLSTVANRDWNDLQADVRLKTHLFTKPFPDYFLGSGLSSGSYQLPLKPLKIRIDRSIDTWNRYKCV